MDTRVATVGSGVQGPLAGNTLYQIPGFITAGQNWGQYGGAGASDCGLTNPPGNAIHAVAIVITILNPNFDAFLGVSDMNDLSTVLSTLAGERTLNPNAWRMSCGQGESARSVCQAQRAFAPRALKKMSPKDSVSLSRA